MASRYVPQLDGLRGTALVGVLAFHAGFIKIGWLGLEVFFVLSGYLITRRLLDTRDSAFRTYLVNFYGRRALRIMPLYFGYLALIVVLARVVALPGDFFGLLPYLATYTFNFTRVFEGWQGSVFYTHFWSLCVEEQFYLVWPFLLYPLSTAGFRRLVVALLIAAPVVRYGLGAWANASGYDFFTSQQFVYWFPLSHFDAFACGGAATVLDRTGSVRRPGLWALALTMVIALCGLANLYSLRSAGIMLPVGTLGLQLAAQWNYQHVWSYTLINMWSAAMILALVDESGRRGLFTRFMASPVPVELGRVSYGMYVFHWPVWWLFLQSVRAVGWRAELLREWLFLPIFVLAVYVVGYASYELYETRFLNLKDRFFASSRTAVR